MSEYLIDSSTLTNIADAIRAKTGSSVTYTPEQMVTAISGISSGVPYWEGTLNVNSSGDLVFPVLSFTPKTIVASSVYQSYEFDEGGYAHSGFICTAFYDEQSQCWFEVIPQASSGILYLAEDSFVSHTREIYKDSNNQYHFTLLNRNNVLSSDSQGASIEEKAFKCRVYG